MSVTPQQALGLFKDVYREAGLVDALPTWAGVQDAFPFEEAEALGDEYVFGVALTKSHSCSYAPSKSASPVSATPVISLDIPRARVESFFIAMRQRIDYRTLIKAKKAGKAAFAQAFGTVLKNLKESHVYRLELSLLYGRDGLGQVQSNTSGALVLTPGSWATGIWNAGLKDCVLEAWSSTGGTATQRNGDLTITAVDVNTRTITVSGTSAAVIANDHLYFKGARTTNSYNECVGLYRILTSSGVNFGIDSAVYDLWRAQRLSVNGQLSMTALLDAAARALPYGLERAIAFVSPEQFGDLASDEAMLRRYNSADDNKKAKRGSRGITFTMGQVEIEVMIHPMMKAEHCMVLPDGEVHRVGAIDVSEMAEGDGVEAGLAGTSFHVHDQYSVEMRTVSDQAIYIEVPAKAVLVEALS